MHTDWPLSRDLVLVGGGHTHALVLRRWGMKPLAGARLTLIDPGACAAYTGMLPGFVAGHYGLSDIEIDLVRLARFAGARIIFDRATGLDREAKQVHLAGRPPLRYDVLSLDIGATAALAGIDGFDTYAHSVKPMGPFAQAWQAFVENGPSRHRAGDCIVIGGGVAGVELALAMAQRLAQAGLTKGRVRLIEAGGQVLANSAGALRRRLIAACARLGVEILTGADIIRTGPEGAHLRDGRLIPAEFIVSAAGARPHDWLSGTGLSLTGGFIAVGPDLRALNDPNVFAVGDCAHLTHAPRPKAGVFAVRQAPVLFHNLRAALSGAPLRSYHPQADYLKLVSMGSRNAAGQKHALTLSGRRVWTLKDYIDRSFMARLNDLPGPRGPRPPTERVRAEEGDLPSERLCGGCGAKVGRTNLAKALKDLGPAMRSDTVRGPGDDSAVLRTGGQLQVFTTDHLRAFIDDPYLMGRITAVHALGDIWAMGAMPQSALLSLIIPQMSDPLQAATVREVTAAVSDVLRSAGADLVGGHTSIGQELTIGLAATGLLQAEGPGLQGAQPGDAIVLTKPLGSGVILAGHMRGSARGKEVRQALEIMQRPLSTPARILAPAAHAMTDVTGFGLAGHLMNLLEASGTAAEVWLAAIPLMPGAERLSAQGVRSSIWQSNASLDARIERPASGASDLLHDPQTAGGLLVALAPADLPGLLAGLAAAGEPAWVIGRFTQGAPFIKVTPP
ncbi:MAG: selenide, water dikinase SelD [Hyphomonas sp.]